MYRPYSAGGAPLYTGQMRGVATSNRVLVSPLLRTTSMTPWQTVPGPAPSAPPSASLPQLHQPVMHYPQYAAVPQPAVAMRSPSMGYMFGAPPMRMASGVAAPAAPTWLSGAAVSTYAVPASGTRARAASNPADAPLTKVVYITDVEGNLTYVRNVLKYTQGIKLNAKDEIELSPGYILVFGGDSCDKAGIDRVSGSLRFLRMLIEARRRYGPERVHFIVGNRDVNKIRLTEELSSRALAVVAECPAFVPENQRINSRDFLEKQLKDSGEFPKDAAVPPEALAKHNTAANRLRWILDRTMGAAGEFEFRRKELALLANRSAEEITDQHVVDSYLHSLNPGGLLYEYLKAGELALVIGNCLFTHGGVIGDFEGDCIGHIPGRSDRVPGFFDWVREINAWYHRELSAWDMARSVLLWNGKKQQRPASDLLDYVATPNNETTCVRARHLDKDSQLRAMEPATKKKLTDVGLKMLVFGHTPHGTCPSVIDEGGFYTLSCDTSYSDFKSPDARGIAASAVEIFPRALRDPSCVAIVRGCIDTGEEIAYVLDSNPDNTGADRLIGKRMSDGLFWVKAKFTEEKDGSKMYYLSQVSGFKYNYDTKKKEDVEKGIQA